MRRSLFGILILAPIVFAIGCGSAVSDSSSATGNSNSVTKYCQLRFGPDGSQKVVLGWTSDTLLLFRSGDINGEAEEYPLTPRGEVAFWNPDNGEIPAIESSGGTSYKLGSISEYKDEGPAGMHALIVNVDVQGDAAFSQYCDVELLERGNELKYAHFDGPLKIQPQMINWKIQDLELELGGEALDLRTNVGTMNAADGLWVVLASAEGLYPDGVHPTVKVEFPTAKPSEPVVETFPLDQFC